MTLDLILIRHAKSSWNDPGLDDHERVLNKRGRKSTDALGGWLAAHEFIPDQVLCSTAIRARQTWEGISAHIGDNAELQTRNGLYLASPREMLEELGTATGACVAMIGHNPGIALFAAGMCNRPSGHPDFNRYPTGATTILRFDAKNWESVSAGEGEILDFVVPRQLVG